MTLSHLHFFLTLFLLPVFGFGCTDRNHTTTFVETDTAGDTSDTHVDTDVDTGSDTDSDSFVETGTDHEVDVAARMAGFSKGVNIDRWFLNPISSDKGTFVTGTDMALIVRLGFDHIRILVHLEQVFTESNPSEPNTAGLAELDQAVELALEHGLNIIVDLHSTDPDHWNRYSFRLENEPGFVDKFVLFWGSFASHLSRFDPERLILQPMNEPIFEGRPNDWYPIQQRLVDTIRASAPRHTIIAVAAEWQSRSLLLNMAPLKDKNIVYDFHYYEPSEFIFQGYYQDATSGWELGVAQCRGLPYPVSSELIDALAAEAPSTEAADMIRQYGAGEWNADKHFSHIAAVSQWAAENNVPVICTEFGIDTVFIPENYQLEYIRDVRHALDAHGIPWTYYDYEQGYGVVRRGNSKIAVDAPLMEALGLSTADTQVPLFSRAVSTQSLPGCPFGLLDDLEDGDAEIGGEAGSTGQWQTYRDDVGSSVSPETFVAAPGGAEGSNFAARASGTIGTASYSLQAGLVINLATPYNAENAAGLSFFAKGSGVFDVNIADDYSTYGTGHCNTCVPFAAPIQLTDTWTRYTVLFEGVQQSPYWGDQFVRLDPRSIHQISWINITPAKQFDIWIDNVEWVGCVRSTKELFASDSVTRHRTTYSIPDSAR